MPTDNLTDADIAAIEHRIWASRFVSQLPQPPPLTGWNKEQADVQAAKLEERRATAHAGEDRQRREREQLAEQRRRAWEANAPARAKAQAELAKVEAELARVDAERDRLADRQADLERVTGR